MKVFVTILALVGAAAATAIPESVEARLMEAHQNQAIMNAERAIHIDEMRSFSVFGAPKLSREVILPTERFGVKGLHDKPMILAVKKFDKNEVVGFLLKHGLKSIFEEPELVNLRKAVLSGPAKMGLMLSAARYLDIPEMSLPMKEILVPGEATLTTAFRISQEYPTMPWMFVTEKDNLRLGSLDKLVELGEFNVFHDKVVLVRDFMPNIMEIPVGVAAARDLELENLNLYPGQRTSLRSLIPLEDTAAFENVERIYPNQRLISTYPYRVPTGQYYTRNQPLRTLSSVNPITINPYGERLSGLGPYSSIPNNVPLVQIY